MMQAQDWHTLDVSAVAARLDTQLGQGLSAAEVARRRERFGRNQLAAKPPRPAWIVFALQFHQPLVYILLAAGLVSGALGEWVDAGVIWAVVPMIPMIISSDCPCTCAATAIPNSGRP